MTATTLDVREIAPDRISPDPDNPRLTLRDIDELAASVKQHGVLDPITVRPDPSSNGSGPMWIVVRGHRRHAAAIKAGVDVGDLDVEEEWLASLKETQLPLALLAWVASHNESKWDPNSWNHGYWKDQRLRYLRFLVSCGYTPALVEKVQLGDAKPADVLAEAERIKEAAKA